MRLLAPPTMTTLRTSFAESLTWAILGLLPLAACGGNSPPETENKEAPGTAHDAATSTGNRGAAEGDPITLSADSSRGNFRIRIRPEGGSIPLNEPFAVVLDLLDPKTGQPLQDHGEVTLDARMPAHGHGMLRDVALVPDGEGSLRAEGLLFHMVGHWEFHVDLTRGPRVERAQASFELTL